MPNVQDRMLEPVPPPANLLGSWRDALRFVHQRSTALHISRAQIDQANAQTRRALALALPRLTGTATVNRALLFGEGVVGATQVPSATGGAPTIVTRTGPIPDPATTLNGALTVTQPLINFGAWYGVGTAKEREHVQEFSAQDTERRLLATVAQAAVSVITASRVAESSRVSLGSALSTLDLTKRRAALGAASAVDVLRAQQEVAQSRAAVVSNDEALRQTGEALGAALGDTASWGVSPEVHVEDLERTASQICRPLESIDTRADIRSAAKVLEAARRDRTAVDYTFAPTVDLSSTLGYVSARNRSPNGEHVAWSVGANLIWPLYDGGDRYGARRQTEAAAAIASETLTQKKRDATVQLTQADRAIAVAQANLEVSTTARDLARESSRLSRIAFVNGSGTSFDLVDSARRLREAEIDLLIKEFGVLQARLTAYLGRANCSI